VKRKYRSYTAKKYKLPKRILFFAICALVIFCFALMVGNNLKKQMENADINREPIETQDFDNSNVPGGIENGNAEHPKDKANIKAGYLDLRDLTDTDDFDDRVDALKKEGFNALSFRVLENGYLTYASKAIEDYSRLPASPEAISMETVASAVSYAQKRNMICSALFLKGNDSVLDAMLCAELSELGFDEIIICGFESLLTENGGEITPCIEYIKSIRASAPEAHISLSLAPSAYTYARNSYQIEKLFTYAEFLTIDMTNLDAEAAGKLCSDISGSFGAYALRPLVKGEAADIIVLLGEKNIEAIQYTSPVPPPETDTETDTNNN